MKILIIEGIPTSGKSSVIQKVSELLKSQNLAIFGEPITHEPIMGKRDELHVEFFKSLIDDAIKSGADLIIFDRLHLTQAYRANVDIAEYSEVEDLLAAQTTLVAYLQVDKTVLAERIRLTAEHRDKNLDDSFEWGDHFRTKGKTFDDIAEYYVKQQCGQLRLLGQSKLASKVFDTTQHGYNEVAGEIIDGWYSQTKTK
jgi:thymidylate kinase